MLWPIGKPRCNMKIRLTSLPSLQEQPATITALNVFNSHVFKMDILASGKMIDNGTEFKLKKQKWFLHQQIPQLIEILIRYYLQYRVQSTLGIAGTLDWLAACKWRE